MTALMPSPPTFLQAPMVDSPVPISSLFNAAWLIMAATEIEHAGKKLNLVAFFQLRPEKR